MSVLPTTEAVIIHVQMMLVHSRVGVELTIHLIVTKEHVSVSSLAPLIYTKCLCVHCSLVEGSTSN